MSTTVLCVCGVVAIASGALALLFRGHLGRSLARRVAWGLLGLAAIYGVVLVAAVGIRVQEGLQSGAFAQMPLTELLVTLAAWVLMLIGVVAPLLEIAWHLLGRRPGLTPPRDPRARHRYQKS